MALKRLPEEGGWFVLHGRKRDLADSLLEGGEMSATLDADALLRLLKG